MAAENKGAGKKHVVSIDIDLTQALEKLPAPIRKFIDAPSLKLVETCEADTNYSQGVYSVKLGKTRVDLPYTKKASTRK
jgi:hypothetical protein